MRRVVLLGEVQVSLVVVDGAGVDRAVRGRAFDVAGALVNTADDDGGPNDGLAGAEGEGSTLSRLPSRLAVEAQVLAARGGRGARLSTGLVVGIVSAALPLLEEGAGVPPVRVGHVGVGPPEEDRLVQAEAKFVIAPHLLDDADEAVGHGRVDVTRQDHLVDAVLRTVHPEAADDGDRAGEKVEVPAASVVVVLGAREARRVAGLVLARYPGLDVHRGVSDLRLGVEPVRLLRLGWSRGRRCLSRLGGHGRRRRCLARVRGGGRRRSGVSIRGVRLVVAAANLERTPDGSRKQDYSCADEEGLHDPFLPVLPEQLPAAHPFLARLGLRTDEALDSVLMYGAGVPLRVGACRMTGGGLSRRGRCSCPLGLLPGSEHRLHVVRKLRRDVGFRVGSMAHNLLREVNRKTREKLIFRPFRVDSKLDTGVNQVGLGASETRPAIQLGKLDRHDYLPTDT